MTVPQINDDDDRGRWDDEGRAKNEHASTAHSQFRHSAGVWPGSTVEL
ncbi:hypothetical protein [Arthrobacter sulfonylureivorans]|uniref:Uncharacterized protein n=1 Tax=Arthrobacter sulfonylureivorans TaxID=2486855 RepID=A0ABY3W5F9_9MICC|nr:hypothetical protein [Arthrobacter sulfonylureivorans]UNK45463.1 hypothetical protein MNQ99_16325 [Arthrobacter sulfonylureivorans]